MLKRLITKTRKIRRRLLLDARTITSIDGSLNVITFSVLRPENEEM